MLVGANGPWIRTLKFISPKTTKKNTPCISSIIIFVVIVCHCTQKYSMFVWIHQGFAPTDHFKVWGHLWHPTLDTGLNARWKCAFVLAIPLPTVNGQSSVTKPVTSFWLGPRKGLQTKVCFSPLPL